MNSYFVPRLWQLAGDRSLELGPRARIMGILNVTPDSFSDGGQFDRLNAAVLQAKKMADEGAVIVDVGGESTRPGADAVTALEEQRRVLPVIEALADVGNLLLSIDTYRSETAELAIKAGACVINDVWGFQKDQRIAGVAAKYGAGVCAMHTGRERTRNPDVINDQIGFLSESLKILKNAGIADDAIVLDPGFGFAKDPTENIQLLARFEELHQLGYPLLTGTSRKRFIGNFTGRSSDSRDIGTAATSVVARMKGSTLFRVHDVRANADALAIADAVISNGRES